MTYYVLFVMDLITRRVRVAGITRNPTERWIMQIAKNLTDPFDGFLRSKRLLIIDRDSKYSEAFRHRSRARHARRPSRSLAGEPLLYHSCAARSIPKPSACTLPNELR